jgi:hypothetical protein
MRPRSFAAVTVAFGIVVAHAAIRASANGEESGARAPERLSETGLYATAGIVDPRNRSFAPQYPLWSDGAEKLRWVYLPPGTRIDARDESQWEFPVGTKFWKEFRFNGRKVETRLLWRASASRWVAASYLWNDEQTDATRAPDEGLWNVVAIDATRRHSIPSANDCTACHGTKPTGPLGFNALQLSTDRDPNAIHGEALVAGMMTLETLVREQLIAGQQHDWIHNPPRIRSSSPRTRAVLGYLAANCGGCHNRSGEIAVLGPSLAPDDVARDGDEVARRLVGHPTRWQVPGLPDGASVLIDPAAPGTSAILARMRSRRPSSQMPPLGSVVKDQAAIDAITRWIELDLARPR